MYMRVHVCVYMYRCTYMTCMCVYIRHVCIVHIWRVRVCLTVCVFVKQFVVWQNVCIYRIVQTDRHLAVVVSSLEVVFLCCLRRILTFFTVCQCFFSEGARCSDQTVLQLHTYVNWQCLIKMPSAFLSDVCKHVWNCLLETRLCVWFVWQCWNSGSRVSAVDCRNYHQATTHCELLVISTPPLHEDPQTEVDIEQDGDVDVRVRCRVVRYLYVFWLTQKSVNVLSAPIDDQCRWSYDLYKYVYYYY